MLLESLAYFNLTSSNFVIDRADQYNCTYSIDSTIVSWRWSKLPYFLSSLTIIYIGLIQKKTFPLETLKWKKIIKQFIFYLIFDSWNKEHLRQEKNIIKIFNLKRIDQNLSEWRNYFRTFHFKRINQMFKIPPTFLSAPPLTKYSPLGEYLTALTKFVWSYKEIKAFRLYVYECLHYLTRHFLVDLSHQGTVNVVHVWIDCAQITKTYLQRDFKLEGWTLIKTERVIFTGTD